MSAMSTLITSGLAALATAKSESLSYATAHGQSFTAMTGFVLIQARPPLPVDDPAFATYMQSRDAVLKGPLTPALHVNYEVKDIITNLIWSVVSEPKVDVQQVAILRLVADTTHSPNRN